MAVSRNDPCPCGSGKKYKRCCLLADEQAGQPPGQEWHRLDERLGGVIGHWAKRRFGETWTESLDVYPIAFGKDLAHYPLFFAWAVYERKIEGRPVASWYLEAQGRNLMAHERDWLAAQLRAWLSVWEVLDVEPGKTVRLKDLLTGEERTVSEVKGSQDLARHLLMLARVVDHAGLSLLAGHHPSPLTPRVGKEYTEDIRAQLALGKRPGPQDLREGDRPTQLIEAWQDSVAAVQQRPLPQLRNSDGEELFFIEDHYKLVGRGACAAVKAELVRMPNVTPPLPAARQQRYTFLRQDADHGTMGDAVVASVVVKAREVVVEANSHKRADGLRRDLEKQFGPIVQFTRRQETAVAEAMAKKGPVGRKAPTPLEGPVVDVLLREFKSQHYGTWADVALPALDGLTPREAASQPKYRARLDTLLKDMEYHESREDPARRFDFGSIRRDLGLGN